MVRRKRGRNKRGLDPITFKGASPDPDLRHWKVRAGDVRHGLHQMRKHELSSHERFRHLGLWRHGFASYAHALYDLEHNDPRDYLSDLAQHVLQRRLSNSAYDGILQNKLTFHTYMQGRFPDNLPDLHGVILWGAFRPWAGDGPSVDVVPLSSALEGTPGLVIKPIDGNQGAKIHVVREVEGRLTHNGREVTTREVDELGARLNNYLVQSFVEQHAYAARLNPTSTNTIRVPFLRDPLSGEVVIPIAVHRIGTQESAPTDNFAKGGIACSIDLETGRLGRAASSTEGRLGWHDDHPEHGTRLTGEPTQNWSDVLDLVHRLGDALPFCNSIGWDLVVAKDGRVVIIEGNHGMGFRTLQLHLPLLQHDRFRALCERYRVIGRQPIADLRP